MASALRTISRVVDDKGAYTVFVTDTSTNGTFVNGVRLQIRSDALSEIRVEDASNG